MKKYLLCVDAGFVSTGLSLFEVTNKKFIFINCHTIKTEKSSKKKAVRVADDDSERVKQIINGLESFIDEYEDQNIMVAIELPTGGAQGARPNRTMGMVTGCVVTYFKMKGWPTEYVTPNDVKIAVTGSKKASKEEIMDKIRHTLRKHEDKLPKAKATFEHIADSIGVALHIKRNSEMFQAFRR